MRALGELKSVGLIKKIGYGTYEINEQGNDKERRCQIVHRVAPTHIPRKVPKLKPDTVRAHGIVATVKVNRQRFLNWSKEELGVVLKEREIPFTTVPQGQRIKVLDVEKVWLTRKSVVYYLPYSWFGETAHECAAKAVEDIIRLNLRLERMLGIDTLKIGGSYWIKFSRQHDALIKNALAMMYDNPRRPIYFRDERGQWGLIDNSYNMHELETTRGEREFQLIKPDKPISPQIRVNDDGAREHNRKVVNFFNGVKDTGITPEFILEMFADSATQIKEAHGQLAFYARNLETHVGAVNTLSSQAQENAKSTVSLREAVVRLSQTIHDYPTAVQRPGRAITMAPKRVDKSPSEYMAEKLVTRVCGLCGLKTRVPGNKTVCLLCEKIVEERKKKPAQASMQNYIG